MNRRIAAIFVIALAIAGSASSQPGRGAGGVLTGLVFDSELQVPIEYANIVLYRQADSAQVTGTVTDEEGAYELTGVPAGRFYLRVSFIGYRTRTVEEIELASGARFDLGRTELRQTVVPVEGVETVGEKPTLTYEIDKKIIDVSKLLTAQSGTAVDALENAPSVTVDIEGNVSLRGSQNFTVLIDGKPTMLEPSEALKQIPAGTIETIEIITNPSAKYDPDGVTGIINVVLKKQKAPGISGLANLNAGLRNRYGGDVLLGYRHGIVNTHVGLDYNRRRFNSTREGENRTFSGSETTHVTSTGSYVWAPLFYGCRGGVELQLSENDKISLSGRYGIVSLQNEFDTEFDERFVPGDSSRRYYSDGAWERDGNYYHLAGDLQHDFDADGHQILARVTTGGWSPDDLTSDELSDSAGVIVSGRRSEEREPSRRLRLKADYTLPLREKDKLEAGFQNRFDYTDGDNRVFLYDTASGGYEPDSASSHSTHGERGIHSLYALYSWNRNQLGVQGGLRGEYGTRYVEMVGEGQRYPFDHWDCFPTVHLSYGLPAGQLMASYTRRIERPHPWLLRPFYTWQDAYNVRKGNPELRPEYINSWEAGYQLPFGAGMLSAETYYRVTSDFFQWVKQLYPEDSTVILHTVKNIGTERNLGVELMLNLNPFKWWGINLSGDVYDHRFEGELYGRDYSRRSFDWNGRVNTDFKLPTGTRLQLTGHYSSPSISSQGGSGAYFMTNIAVNQDLLNRTLSVTLRVRDVLGTGRWESTYEGDGFYSHQAYIGESRVITLALSYNFNSFQLDPKMRQGDEMQGGGPQM